jgi:exodeoxyribonuclease VII small subunit
MATRKKSIDFETSLKQLESIVENLEEGNLGLEDSLKAFEKGIKITRECQQALQKAEQRVRVLTTDPNGEIVSSDFVPEEIE